jgi:hypothetical protein
MHKHWQGEQCPRRRGQPAGEQSTLQATHLDFGGCGPADHWLLVRLPVLEHGKHLVVGKQAQVLFHTAARRLITRGGGGGVNAHRRAAAPLELRAAGSWHSNARR